MKNEKDTEHKPALKKCGIPWDWGIGIATKNPRDVSLEELRCYNNVNWIWFEDYWYIVKKDFTDMEIEDYVNDSYSKEQVLEKIIDLVTK